MNFINKVKKISIFLILFIKTYSFSQSQSPVFLGVISSDADENMINMTEDMFFKQISDFFPNAKDFRFKKKETISQINLESFEITDIPLKSENTVIFASIKKIDETNGKWQCRIFYKLQNSQTKVFEKEYDSYYKILMESKDFFQGIFNSPQKKKDDSPKEKKQEPKKNPSVTIEILAGTWTGEKNISKVVILRGGRGFIIFTNGASMNINVSIDENSFIHVKQTSSSNASFYPELPRKNALEIAPFAKPIEWILQYNDDDTLSGIKNTITLNQNQDPVQTEIKVLWNRKSPF